MSGPSVSRQTTSTYALPRTATTFTSGSTRSHFYNQPQPSSPSASTTTKPPKLRIPSKPDLPSYLADTSFAELYHSVSAEAFAINAALGDKDPSELVALPTAWNIDDRCSHLELSADKLGVHYTVGSGKNDTDAAAIRANHPMPPQCGLFYFEVEIISKGRDGYIGIGFCGKGVNLARLPGWEPQSWGYHGDDGNSFCCSGTGKHYGPKFTTGDTIGCCLNFRDGTAFYTKNGFHLGIAFRDLKGVLYPSIGLRTPGEKIQVNFGQRAFKFAIEHYMKEEKARLWNAINAIPMSPISTPLSSGPFLQAASEANLTATVHQLILSYLVHHGFSETAKAFSRDAVQLPTKDTNSMEGIESQHNLSDVDVDMLNRQRIRNAILKGDIDFAIKLTNGIYPTVLPSNDDILFRLRCRKFIEMMGQCAGYRISSSDDEEEDVVKVARPDTMLDADDDDEEEGGHGILEVEVELGEDEEQEDEETEEHEEEEEEEEEEDDDDEDDEDDDEYEDAMDVDDFAISHSDEGSLEDVEANHITISKKKKAARRRRVMGNGMNGLSEKFEAAMRFGQELQDDYRNDTREEIKKALEETFSLLAYSDPTNCVMSHLLDPSGREPVANSLNSAILVSQGKPQIPPLEKVYRQASVSIKELLRNGVGAGSFVNVQKDCLI